VKRFGKIAAGVFFVVFFLLFLITGTLRFELLNSSFVFSSLERNGIYEKLPSELGRSLVNDPNLQEEEKEGYTKIISAIPPAKFKKLFETNISGVFDYLNGGADDITLSLSPSDLGIPFGGDINWSLSKTPPQEFRERVKVVYGIGNILLGVLVVLIVLLFLLFRVAGRAVLLITGILAVVLGGVGRLFLWVVSSNTPVNAEPSQVLLRLLSISILPDIAISWLFLGAVFIGVWVYLKK